MSHCSPLSEAAAAAVEVENMEETAVSAELERTFGENPTASNSERYAASMNAEDDQDEVLHIMQSCGRATSWRVRLAHLGLKPCQSQMAMKLSCTRTFLSPACACFRI
jgi:hypothetical protein